MAKTKNGPDLDGELAAMTAVEVALRSVSDEARLRILRYIIDLLDLDRFCL